MSIVGTGGVVSWRIAIVIARHKVALLRAMLPSLSAVRGVHAAAAASASEHWTNLR